MPAEESGKPAAIKFRNSDRRFRVAPVPNGESASYLSDPYNQSVNTGFLSTTIGGGKKGAIGTIVLPSDNLLASKGGVRALNLYQNLFLDEHVQACFSKLVQEITSRPFYIRPYSDKPGDVAVAEFVENTIKELPLDRIYRGLAEAMIVGLSIGEVMWRKTPRGVIPYDVRLRDQRRFVFEENEKATTGFSLRCLTLTDTFQGNELPERKFIVHRYWSQNNGDPYGFGIGRALYPLVKFRRRAIESYVLFGDRFATPTAVGKAPLSATEEDIDTVYDMLSNMSQETAIVVPEGWEIDLKSPSGNSEVFTKLIDYIDKEISILICGENEAGQAEAGSRASSEVANLVRVVRASETSEDISQKLSTTLIRWIVDLNFGVDVMAPALEREFRIEESTLAASDLALIKEATGFMPTKEWLERHFRVEFQEELAPIEGQEEPGFTPEDGGEVDLYDQVFGTGSPT
ncbi:portal protein [Synechococcus phage S-CBWM1]|uniref:Portal protein n=1 Tax=Synechococcus phage S-CBWM1 TaxID=2053653 RepID=A0A3G1L3U6_9CAUD|nr:portal protein [Synechococcus phage S-CBWM1]ATW62853.1 portal protein [Synechococcus phage S-CBWM1]